MRPSKTTGWRLGQGRLADKHGRRDPVEHSPAQVLEPKISDITSERVASFCLNALFMALVTNELSGLFTPRMVMQLWLASITTATPLASSLFHQQIGQFFGQPFLHLGTLGQDFQRPGDL